MVTFRPHQEKAINDLRPGSILIGGTGSGKSRTSLGYFIRKECYGDKGCTQIKRPMPLLIITIAKKRDSKEWDNECAVFGLSQNEEESFYGIKVKIDSWNNIKKYLNFKNGFVIFDEQKVVGSGAWVRSFHKITKNNHWILLSATPGDTWMDYIPVFIANGYYKTRKDFLWTHAVYNRYSKYPKIDRWIAESKLEYLRKKILVEMPFEKQTVMNHIDIQVDYDRELYRKVIKDRWNPYKNWPIQNVSELYALMRKVVNSDPSRLTALESIINSNDRIIVFYSFDYEIELLRTLKDKVSEDIVFAEWNGHNHEEIPKSDKWVYFVNYMSGAEGWECTETDTVVFYSMQYSYRTAVQSYGRIDRLNTPYKNLYCYWLKSKAWIDVAISRAMKQKKDFHERRNTIKF